MMSAIQLFESAAVVTLAVLFVAFLGDRLSNAFWLRSLLYGAVFALTGLISMSAPVQLAPGIIVDARNVVVALSTAIGGPLSGIMTATAVAVMRAHYGGTGALPGIVSIVVITALSSVVWFRCQRTATKQIGPGDVVTLALIAAATPIVVILSPLVDFRAELIVNAARYSVPTSFLGTLLFGFLFISDHQRRWALSAYSESQAQLQAIANNAPGVLFQMTRSRTGNMAFRYVSGGAERILGVSADEIVKHPGTLARMISADALRELDRLLEASLDSRSSWKLETQVARPDGSVLWMRAAAEPRLDKSGEMVWDGTLLDISEEKRNAQLRNEFVSTVSHELRTPLTSIRGSLGLIAAGAAGALPDKAANLVRIAHSNSERLVRLINDILDIEKIESDRMPFDISTMALAPLLEQSIEASRSYLGERGVSITLVDDAPGGMMRADPDRLHQVMSNFLSNAIKFSPEGGKVVVRIARHDKSLRIGVRDEGPGIPEAFHSRIFGKFEQADASDSREKGGTGLGLSIVKAVVERLDGRVWFETEVGRGTTFFAEFPEIGGVDAGPSGSIGDDDTDSKSVSSRVLICEDEPDVADVIALILREQGIATDIAADGATAKSLIAGRTYAAMTLDVRLGRESGIELFREIREMPLGKNLPVIIVSAVADEARRTLNGSALGVVEWLGKPIDTRRLQAAIEKLRAGSFKHRPRVLHIEDDEDVLQVISATLGDDMEVMFAKTAAEAQTLLNETGFDLVLLDIGLPDGSGADLLNHIADDVPVIIFSANDIDEGLASKVEAAMTKTRSSEIAIADLVKKLIAKAPMRDTALSSDEG